MQERTIPNKEGGDQPPPGDRSENPKLSGPLSAFIAELGCGRWKLVKSDKVFVISYPDSVGLGGKMNAANDVVYAIERNG